MASKTELTARAETSGSIEASLDLAIFVCLHRSFLVRLDRIRAIDLYAKNRRVATLLDGTRVPVSREGHARLQELLRGS